MKIAILYDVWEEEGAVVEPPEPKPAARKAKGRKKKKREKEDREEIFEAVEKLGHEPSYQVLDGTPQCLTSLAKCEADLVFNLTESFAGDDTKEMHVAAYLDLLGLRYTGAGPHASFLAQDKAIAKKMFAFHGIRTPYFATSYRGSIEHAHDIAFPLIVKPVSEDGSIGINSNAVVDSVKELMERVQYIQDEFDSPAIIEEYIEGREIYAAILGSYEYSEVLPLVELDFSKLPKGTPKIASYDVKFEKETEAFYERRSLRARSQPQPMALEQTGIRYGGEGQRALLFTVDRPDRGPGNAPLPRALGLRRFSVEANLSCVDCHSYYCIDSQLVKLIDFFLAGDSTGGD